MTEPMTELDATLADLSIACDLSESIPDDDGLLCLNVIRVRELLGEIARLRDRVSSLEEKNTRLALVRLSIERNAQAAHDAVLAIHQRMEMDEYGDTAGGGTVVCSYCREGDEEPTPWPCATAKAVGVAE